MARILTVITILFFFAASATPAEEKSSQTPGKSPAAAPAAKQTPGKPFVYTPKSTDIVMGKPEAPVTIVEYASLSCPHCAHFFTHVLPDLTTQYLDTGKAKLVYRDYPLNAPALKGAELVQCADKERRHAFLKVLFTTQSRWALDINYKEALANIAALGGIDRAKFNACMSNKKIEDAILATAKEAQDVYKVSATPTFFINGKEEEGDHGMGSMGQMITDAAKASALKK